MGEGVRISALHGGGIDKLLEAVEQALPEKMKQVRLLLPFSQAGLAARIRREGEVLTEEYVAEGLRIDASIPPSLSALVEAFEIPAPEESAGETGD